MRVITSIEPRTVMSNHAVTMQRTPAQKTLNELLQETEWMRPLSEPLRERVIRDAHERFHAPGDTVARRGAAADCWIGVAEGLIKVSTTTAAGRGLTFTALSERCWVGEGSLLKREPRRYDLVALRPSRTIHIPGPTFEWLLDVSLEFNRFIIRHLNEWLGQFVGALETSRVADPTTRLAGSICSLLNAVSYPNASRFLRFSQAELGELAGLSRATTNAAIKKLEKLGAIRPVYSGLVVESIEILYQAVEVVGERQRPGEYTRSQG